MFLSDPSDFASLGQLWFTVCSGLQRRRRSLSDLPRSAACALWAPAGTVCRALVVVRLLRGCQAESCAVLKSSHALLLYHLPWWSFIRSQEECFFLNAPIGDVWATGRSVSSLLLSWEKCLVNLGRKSLKISVRANPPPIIGPEILVQFS